MDDIDATTGAERVAVAGTDATTDTQITMLEGATGARIPTGEHRRSGAMPAAGAGTGAAGGSRTVPVIILALAVIVLVAIVGYLVAG